MFFASSFKLWGRVRLPGEVGGRAGPIEGVPLTITRFSLPFFPYFVVLVFIILTLFLLRVWSSICYLSCDAMVGRHCTPARKTAYLQKKLTWREFSSWRVVSSSILGLVVRLVVITSEIWLNCRSVDKFQVILVDYFWGLVEILRSFFRILSCPWWHKCIKCNMLYHSLVCT